MPRQMCLSINKKEEETQKLAYTTGSSELLLYKDLHTARIMLIMTFPLLSKKTWQPSSDMCVSASFKVMCDNQFGSTKISLSTLNKWCKYEGKYGGGIPLSKLREYLTPKLAQLGIIYNEDEQKNIDFLYNLRQEGIYPLVVFHLRDYNEWKKRGNIEVFSDGEPNLHVLIVVDIDKENEKIKIFDCWLDKYRIKNSEDDDYDELSFRDFYSYWSDEGLIYPVFWLSQQAAQKINKHQSRLRF